MLTFGRASVFQNLKAGELPQPSLRDEYNLGDVFLGVEYIYQQCQENGEDYYSILTVSVCLLIQISPHRLDLGTTAETMLIFTVGGDFLPVYGHCKDSSTEKYSESQTYNVKEFKFMFSM